MVACLLACVAIGAVWFYRTNGHRSVNVSNETSGREQVTLSAGTKAVLQRIDSPLEGHPTPNSPWVHPRFLRSSLTLFFTPRLDLSAAVGEVEKNGSTQL